MARANHGQQGAPVKFSACGKRRADCVWVATRQRKFITGQHVCAQDQQNQDNLHSGDLWYYCSHVTDEEAVYSCYSTFSVFYAKERTNIFISNIDANIATQKIYILLSVFNLIHNFNYTALFIIFPPMSRMIINWNTPCVTHFHVHVSFRIKFTSPVWWILFFSIEGNWAFWLIPILM